MREDRSNALLWDLALPSNHLIKSDLAVVMEDKFPKFKFHYLVLPWEDIDNQYQLQLRHIPLLEEMRRLALAMVKRVASKQCPEDRFLMGFHMKPTKRRLHLHCFSQDYVSGLMKSADHWNGFMTGYLMSVDDIIRELQETGSVARRSESVIAEQLRTPLKCNQCNFQPLYMSLLKQHLQTEHQRYA
ncbi:aprataxin-like protein [Uranotaenia lowii]|uniref:aprataxin-like protein n=1 Tax=Uranotaenia lowii TaxID=190385 RepID=UPI0024790B03|nr:aprataxin-like protein [Uranotaenia lowii]